MTQDLSEFRARHPKHLGEAGGYCLMCALINAIKEERKNNEILVNTIIDTKNREIEETRNAVLDEVKNSLEKELEKWDESAEELEDGWGNYTVCLPWELKEKKVDISTTINNLRVK